MEENAEHIEEAIRIAALIAQKAEGATLESDEQALLDAWLNQPNHRDLYRQLSDRNYLLEQVQMLGQWNDKERISAIIKEAVNASENIAGPVLAKVNENIPLIKPAHRIHFLRTAWLRYSAAVILLFGIGVYLWNANKPLSTQSSAEKAYLKNDIAPGGDKALLTLADGRKIALDSAGNGELALQNGARIIKSKDGQIIYYPGSSPVAHGVAYNTMSTPRGGQYTLTLPDGTRVWLNATSSITFPTAFQGTLREVTITGEAYFEVVKKAGVAFSVTVRRSANHGDMHVQVLGTHFNINAYDNEEYFKTTLLEGSVKINDQLVLSPGQQSQLDKNGGLGHTAADIAQDIAWKEGLFNFSSSDIGTVMRQVERWYDIDVKYKGAKTTDRFTGKIKRSVNLSELLKILAYSKVHFQLEDRTLTVLP
ncbi:MAG: FecR domain-containing protein [Flavitalea sp.]